MTPGPVVLERVDLGEGCVLVTDYENRQRSPHRSDPKMPFETKILWPDGSVRAGPIWSQVEQAARLAHDNLLTVARRHGQ